MNIKHNRQLNSTLNTRITFSPESNNVRMTSQRTKQTRGRDKEEEITEGRRRETEIQKRIRSH